jgi:hypothetical protein
MLVYMSGIPSQPLKKHSRVQALPTVAGVTTPQEFQEAATSEVEHIVINNHLDLTGLTPLQSSPAVIGIGASVKSITVRWVFVHCTVAVVHLATIR